MSSPIFKSPIVLIRNYSIGRPISQKRPFLSLIQKPKLTYHDTSSSASLQSALDHAVSIVKHHDPAGYLPGRLLATHHLQVAYFAVRSFWIETGLRFGTTSLLVQPTNTTTPPSPSDHLEWWQQGIDYLYNKQQQEQQSTNHSDHPTFQLLSYLLEQQPLMRRCHFDDILKGRFRDLDMKQYPDLASLEEHAEWSCGSLMQLLLESEGHFEEATNHDIIAHRVAKLLGKAHGLTNALRTSIPVMSTTGKLVIPQELCERYGVRSPRYLLSALGQGDDECKQALRYAVRDISNRALEHLQQARALREELLVSSSATTTTTKNRLDHHHNHDHVLGIFLPGLASETFLQRLKAHNYDLTDRNLRNVNWSERAQCSLRMIHAAYTNKY